MRQKPVLARRFAASRGHGPGCRERSHGGFEGYKVIPPEPRLPLRGSSTVRVALRPARHCGDPAGTSPTCGFGDPASAAMRRPCLGQVIRPTRRDAIGCMADTGRASMPSHALADQARFTV
jgi:hypothetical protein